MVNNLMKWLLRVLASILGVSAVAVLGMSIFDKSPDSTLMLMPATIYGLMAWGFWHWSGNTERNIANNKKNHDLIVNETLTFFESVNSDGKFPVSPTERIISRPECPVLASCNARLMEVSTEQVRQYLGTRVKVAGVPIYLGQSTPKSRSVVRETAQGELAITSKSLLFNGPQRSADVDLNKITALDIALDGITVSIKGKQKPFIFIVPNGFLWGMLIKNMTQLQVEGRDLPPGAKLQVL